MLLSGALLMTDRERAAGKKLPLMRQAQIMLKAMPKATRVAEFIALWTIAKYNQGETSTEKVAEFWNEPVRTMYRRLDEFRVVWAPVNLETPDDVADALIANYKRRKAKLEASDLARLLTDGVTLPASAASVVPNI